MRIYVISKGYYCSEDYRICGATISETKAEIMKNLFSNESEKARIEVFEDGDGENDIRVMWFYYPKNDETKMFPDIFQNTYKGEGLMVDEETGDIKYVCVFAKDNEQVKEKAQDMIAKYKNRMKK